MDKSTGQYSLYMIFASLSILLNLVTQFVLRESFLAILPNFSNNVVIIGKISLEYWFILSLGFGTLIGFIFKFIVDKFVVFEEKLTDNRKVELERTTKQITIYFGFAIFTTMIFWGFEFSFKILLEGNWYLVGGLIGLIIGYTVKFILDRRFVFNAKG